MVPNPIGRMQSSALLTRLGSLGVLWRRVRWYLHPTPFAEPQAVGAKARSKYFRRAAPARDGCWKQAAKAGDESWCKKLRRLRNTSLWSGQSRHHPTCGIKWCGTACPHFTVLLGLRARGVVVVREVMLCVTVCSVCVSCEMMCCVLWWHMVEFVYVACVVWC